MINGGLVHYLPTSSGGRRTGVDNAEEKVDAKLLARDAPLGGVLYVLPSKPTPARLLKIFCNSENPSARDRCATANCVKWITSYAKGSRVEI
jgi:hypothetical protein